MVTQITRAAPRARLAPTLVPCRGSRSWLEIEDGQGRAPPSHRSVPYDPDPTHYVQGDYVGDGYAVPPEPLVYAAPDYVEPGYVT